MATELPTYTEADVDRMADEALAELQDKTGWEPQGTRKGVTWSAKFGAEGSGFEKVRGFNATCTLPPLPDDMVEQFLKKNKKHPMRQQRATTADRSCKPPSVRRAIRHLMWHDMMNEVFLADPMVVDAACLDEPVQSLERGLRYRWEHMHPGFPVTDREMVLLYGRKEISDKQTLLWMSPIEHPKKPRRDDIVRGKGRMVMLLTDTEEGDGGCHFHQLAFFDLAGKIPKMVTNAVTGMFTQMPLDLVARAIALGTTESQVESGEAMCETGMSGVTMLDEDGRGVAALNGDGSVILVDDRARDFDDGEEGEGKAAEEGTAAEEGSGGGAGGDGGAGSAAESKADDTAAEGKTSA